MIYINDKLYDPFSTDRYADNVTIVVTDDAGQPLITFRLYSRKEALDLYDAIRQVVLNWD